MEDFNEKAIRKNLKIDARALGIPSGTAEIYIEHVLKNLQKTLKTKKIITENDLNRYLVKELKKYHADLAYVYEIRDKII